LAEIAEREGIVERLRAEELAQAEEVDRL